MPILFTVFGFFIAITASRYNNFQTRTQQICILWIITGLLSIFLFNYVAVHQLIFLFYPFAHFIQIFYASIKKLWLAEALFTLMFGAILFLNYQSIIPKYKGKFDRQIDQFTMEISKTKPTVINKKILVLGNDLNPYLQNQTASPYVNWSFAKSEFSQLNNYKSVIKILENFKKSNPEYIFDQENIMPKVFERIPSFKNDYKKLENNLYKKI